MRNRALHGALREFALEAAALLTDEVKKGAELEFEVTDEGPRRGPALYVYRPLTGRFIAERWHRLRGLPTCAGAADALGAGAAQYLRVNGLRGAQAEPALQAMLERLYEDATSFGFPEERFERVYDEVEGTLYKDSLRTTILAPLPGLWLESARVELGDGLALVCGDSVEAPHEAVWPEEGSQPHALCLLERDVAPEDPLPAIEARERFRGLVTGLRLFKEGGVSLGAVGWRRAAEGRWQPLELEGAGPARGEPWLLAAEEEVELREFLEAIDPTSHGGPVAWALARFEMGCSRRLAAEALSDHLLALRALLDASSEVGRASLPLRLAALCAEEGQRRTLQRRVELALTLERFVMGGGREDAYLEAIGSEPPRDLVSEMERHLRALLRDVMCGYLDPDLKGVADDILLESLEPAPAPPPPAEDDTSEIEAVGAGPIRASRAAEWRPLEPEEEPEGGPEGVTPSADWTFDDDPESYSAPV